DAQPAERLEDAGALAPSARRETLHGDRLAHRRFRHDERVDVQIVVVLGIGDRAGEHLARVLRHRPLAESEDVERVLGLLAADQGGDEVELLRRATDRGADRERLVVADATGSLRLAHQRLPFLSASWPWKVR